MTLNTRKHEHQWAMKGKLRESQVAMQKLSLATIFIIPLLLGGVVFMTVWTESNYKDITSLMNLGYLFQPVKFFIPFCSLLVLFQILELIHARAIHNENLTFCRMQSTVTPILWSVITATFSLVIWNSLNPLENGNETKFIIIVACIVVLVSSLLNYYIKILAKYVHLMNIVRIFETKYSYQTI